MLLLQLFVTTSNSVAVKADVGISIELNSSVAAIALKRCSNRVEALQKLTWCFQRRRAYFCFSLLVVPLQQHKHMKCWQSSREYATSLTWRELCRHKWWDHILYFHWQKNKFVAHVRSDHENTRTFKYKMQRICYKLTLHKQDFCRQKDEIISLGLQILCIRILTKHFNIFLGNPWVPRYGQSTLALGPNATE